jgi:hypothetical protein
VHESARPTERHKHEGKDCVGKVTATRYGPRCSGYVPAPDEYAVLDTGGVSEDAVDVAARAGQADLVTFSLADNADDGLVAHLVHAECAKQEQHRMSECGRFAACVKHRPEPQEPGEGKP